jgi:hypothetical protein
MDMVWQLPCGMEFRGERPWSRNRRTDYVGGVMSGILVFVHKWKACNRVLRYRNGFSLLDSVQGGLRLARG